MRLFLVLLALSVLLLTEALRDDGTCDTVLDFRRFDGGFGSLCSDRLVGFSDVSSLSVGDWALSFCETFRDDDMQEDFRLRPRPVNGAEERYLVLNACGATRVPLS